MTEKARTTSERFHLVTYLAGFLTCLCLIYALFFLGSEIPLITGAVIEPISPSDWISDKDIIVYEDMIILNIPGASLSNYADTGSMKPLIDSGANGIRIRPKSEEQIHLGDIISFKVNGKMIVHRIVEVGSDNQGVFYITKGDNLTRTDGKIRFSDIEWVTIGVLW